MRTANIMADTAARTPLVLSAYRINADLVSVIIARPSMSVVLEDKPLEVFLSPICEVYVGSLRFFVSGEIDELESRFRGQ